MRVAFMYGSHLGVGWHLGVRVAFRRAGHLDVREPPRCTGGV